MSVFNNPVYRDNAFQASARALGIGEETVDFLTQLCNFEIEEFGKHDIVIPFEKGNLMKQLPKSNKQRINVFQLLHQRKQKVKYPKFVEMELKDRVVHFGLNGVYRFANKVYDRERKVAYHFSPKFATNLSTLGAYCGKHSPQDVTERTNEYISQDIEKYNHLRDSFLKILKVAMGFKQSKYKFEMLDFEDKNEDEDYELLGFQSEDTKGLPLAKYFPFPGVMFVVFPFEVYVLTKADIERLDKLLNGFRLYMLYLANYQTTEKKFRKMFEEKGKTILELVLRRAKELDNKQIQLLCRCLDVAYYIVLARLSSDISNVAVQSQLKKVEDEKLYEVLDPRKIADMVKEFKPKEQLELMSFYKCLPAADFDYFGAMHRQSELYSKQNKITDKLFFQRVLAHHKLLMIKAFHSRHGICPGKLHEGKEAPNHLKVYPLVNPQKMQPSDVEHIDLSSAFTYSDHSMDIWDLVKDKSICPLNVEKVRNTRDLSEVPKREKNQLLDVIYRQEIISMPELRENILSQFCDIKTEDKAEAKKPNGRWFMEAHTNMRLLLSEYEQSIANYGTHLEGFMQGKGVIDKKKMMNHVTEYTLPELNTTQLFISFDINKFSPRLPIEIHKELDLQWADAFGYEHIKHMSRIYTDGELHYIKGPIHHKMEKRGNDFEGFFGRKLTFYHLAVMHAAIDDLKAEKLIFGHARYAAQIDDGLMRVFISTEDLAKTMAKIERRLSEIWLGAGIEISWDKTFLSSTLAVFLNEIYFVNKNMSPGVKAFLKLTNRPDSIAPSFYDFMQMAESTTRGAIVSAVSPVVAYIEYVILVLDAIRVWGPKDLTLTIPFIPWVLAPVNLGGAGMQNITTLCGSLDPDAFSNGVSNLVYLANVLPMLSPQIEIILNQEFRAVPEHTKVTNPMGLRREGPTFRNDRAKIVIEKFLSELFNQPVLSAFNLAEGVLLAELAISYVANHAQTPVEARQLFSDSMPTSAVDRIAAKVTNARTAIQLVPRKVLYRCSLAYMNEARQVFNSWATKL